MKATLTRVGPYGVQTSETGTKWVSNGKGKYEAVKNLQDFQAGNEVEIEYVENGQYLNLKSLVLVKEGTTTAVVSKNGYSKSYKTNPEDALRMSRAAAVNAVFGSPTFAAHLQNADISQAFNDLESESVRATNYILNGKFSDNLVTQEDKDNATQKSSTN